LKFAEKLAVDHQKIDDTLWTEVRRQFTEAEVLELVAHTTLHRLRPLQRDHRAGSGIGPARGVALAIRNPSGKG
jgi:hypothetical protein